MLQGQKSMYQPGGSGLLQKDIVCESANMKVSSYEVRISNVLFEGTNGQHIFSKVFDN